MNIIERAKLQNVGVKQLSTNLKINRSTFYRKQKNNSFTIKEAKILSALLKLNNSEIIEIFFN